MKKSIAKILLIIFIFIILIIYIFPYLYLVLTSFKSPNEVLSIPPKLFPSSLSIENYCSINKFPKISMSFLNSIIIATLSTFFTIVLAIPAAYAISRYSTFPARIFLTITLCIRMVPYISIAIPLFFIMKMMNLAGTYFAVIIGHMTIGLPLAIWLMASFFEGIPIELEDAAQIDGCSKLGALLKVIIPISLNGISVAALFSFLASWNDFIFALFLTSINTTTAPLAIARFNSQYGVNWGIMTALATLFSLPVIFVSFYLQKKIVSGVTIGAVKG